MLMEELLAEPGACRWPATPLRSSHQSLPVLELQACSGELSFLPQLPGIPNQVLLEAQQALSSLSHLSATTSLCPMAPREGAVVVVVVVVVKEQPPKTS